MKICKNYNSAVGKYGEPLVRQMLSAGIPDKYLLSACRFHCSLPKKSINILKVQFRQWMTYVVPFVRGVDVNNLTYEQFDELIRKEQQKHICPNPIYDDGNITIGEFKNKKDAALCPLKPLYDNDYGFCVCSEMGFIKYSKQGYRILVILDKSKALSNDNTKYMFALVKDGVIYLWNANNLPVGSTEKPFGNEAWQYIDNLPDKVQEVLLTFARQTKLTESKTNKNMKEKRKAILSLCKTFPTGHRRVGEPTLFEKNLVDGVKIHTVRSNEGNAWAKRCQDVMQGRKYLSVRQWTGRPYNSKQEEIARFDKIGLQNITMAYNSEDGVLQCWVDGHRVPVETVAANDGLSTEDFVNWFFGRNPKNIFEGVVIQFTDFRY